MAALENNALFLVFKTASSLINAAALQACFLQAVWPLGDENSGKLLIVNKKFDWSLGNDHKLRARLFLLPPLLAYNQNFPSPL